MTAILDQRIHPTTFGPAVITILVGNCFRKSPRNKEANKRQMCKPCLKLWALDELNYSFTLFGRTINSLKLYLEKGKY